MESLKLSSYGPGTVQVQSKSDLKISKDIKKYQRLGPGAKVKFTLPPVCPYLILTIRNLTKELDTDGVRLVHYNRLFECYIYFHLLLMLSLNINVSYQQVLHKIAHLSHKTINKP